MVHELEAQIKVSDQGDVSSKPSNATWQHESEEEDTGVDAREKNRQETEPNSNNNNANSANGNKAANNNTTHLNTHLWFRLAVRAFELDLVEQS